MEALSGTSPLSGYRRLTIKIGSALLVDGATGRLRADWLRGLAEDLDVLRQQGREIVVVSSGAVALGRRVLGINARTLTLEQSQAAASVGQIALSEAWSASLARHGIVTGQILITPNITEERRYYLNARTTINTLLAMGAIPIINENDSVATSEIRYGDNDRLSARVATMIEADCLILLSDVDGLYTAPPARDPEARHLARIASITEEIEAMAGGAASHTSRGGMITKIEAGKIATKAGTAMIIARGTDPRPLDALSKGARHSLFEAAHSPAAARKRWILGTIDVRGRLLIDQGAAEALRKGKSLLPIGVTEVAGDFSRGDAVAIVGPDGRELARGLAGFGSKDARRAQGLNSRAIAEIFGKDSRTELVHRDNMVLVSAEEEAR
ncbi:MAG TPA: glutamate 5-kinase [Devosiaceae bacterium]